MFVDNVKLIIKAGNGGNGASTFLRNGMTARGGPDGGNGGNGGDIYFQGSANLNDLKLFRFKKKITADDGVSGKHRKLYGKNAEHTTIRVPLGTRITNLENGKVFEITDENTPILLARGGKGGRGNFEFRTAINQAPTYSELGTLGQKKELHLELRLIADIGLIGLPNAGKSSLLAAVTNANPKIANYPFTTLEPNIGMMDNLTIADIPGLIEGASTGKGLGIKFLKHIEKTKILLHCIDSSDPDPKKTYDIVRNEFAEFNKELLEKPEVIVLTKTDLVDEKTLTANRKIFEKLGKEVIGISLFDDDAVETLTEEIKQFIQSTNDQKSL